ncbi:MAG: 6-hydroxymethylpterin diphosphokinase MptE-like protein [Candidatus Altiarchaeota archaeon]
MDYPDIAGLLGLNRGRDERARDILDSLLEGHHRRVLKSLICDKAVLVFGCGPSLVEDIRKLKYSHIFDDTVVIAADGSVKALLESRVPVHVNVTDLDGDIDAILKANRMGTLTVVHAHGDNIGLLGDVIPKLVGTVMGSTQVEPTEKILNYGGFTDGDRAVRIALYYKPKLILLAGMDFGQRVGRYSGRYVLEKKLKKLAIGKRLIEEAASKTSVPMYNLTSGGEDIRGVLRASLEDLPI